MTLLPAGAAAPVQRRAVAYVIDALIANAIAIVAFVLFFVVWSMSAVMNVTARTAAASEPV